MSKDNLKKVKYTDTPFWGGTILLTIMWALLFFRCSQEWDYGPHMDIAKYILIQEIDFSQIEGVAHILSYPLYHVVLKLIHLLGRIDYGTAMAVELSVANICSILLFRKLLTKITSGKNSYYIDFLSIFSMVFMPARCGLNEWRFYAWQCGPNPVHNPTIIFVRPFGILCFLLFLYLFDNLGKRKHMLCAGAFSMILFLSVLAKPSWAVTFLPAMGIYTLIWMIKEKRIKKGLECLLLVSPSLILLIWQNLFVLSNTVALDVKIQFGSFAEFGVAESIATTIVVIPVVILLFDYKRIVSSNVMLISCIALVIGWLQMYFLSNGKSGDFSWGYDLAVQMATIVVLADMASGKASNSWMKIRRVAALVLFGYQCIVGIQYMHLVYITGNYWF